MNELDQDTPRTVYDDEPSRERVWTLVGCRELRRLTRRLAILFSPWLLFPLAILANLYLLAILRPWIEPFAPLKAASWSSASIGVLLGVSTLLIHEFGHAGACTRYRHLPRRLAFTLVGGWNPVLYIGVIWRGELYPRHEAIILLAGSALQLQAAAAFAILAALVPALSSAFLVAAWSAWALAMSQLIPIPSSDGYQALQVLRGR